MAEKTVAELLREVAATLEEQWDAGDERATNMPAPDEGAQIGVSVQLVTVLTGDHQPNPSLVVVARAVVGIGPWLETALGTRSARLPDRLRVRCLLITSHNIIGCTLEWAYIVIDTGPS